LDRRLGKSGTALTSDVFVSVLQRMDRLVGGVAGLRTFVMSVAHARYVDEARRRRRQPQAAAYDATLDPRITGSAEDEALAYVGAASILVLLRSLPADQREVLSLRFVADLAIDDVAAIIGRSPGPSSSCSDVGCSRCGDCWPNRP
jgi:RNA polymerase sigma factor (sigma-70 family)